MAAIIATAGSRRLVSAAMTMPVLELLKRDGKWAEVGGTSMIGKQKAARPRITVGSLVEIKFLYVGAGGRLYQPSVKCLRDDVEESEFRCARAAPCNRRIQMSERQSSCMTCKCGRLMDVWQQSRTRHATYETAEVYVCRDRHWWNCRQHTAPISMHARIPKQNEPDPRGNVVISRSRAAGHG